MMLFEGGNGQCWRATYQHQKNSTHGQNPYSLITTAKISN